MSKYSTIVFLDQDIYEKTQLYRQFLEKSEFETVLKDTCFKKMNEAEDFSSAEFNNVRNCIFLYGMIDKSRYTQHCEEIEQKYKNNPNPNYYMIFCQKMYNNDGSYDYSKPINSLTQGVFHIGVIENNGSDEDNRLSDEQLQNERCLKLLSLVISVCIKNNSTTPVIFGKSYLTATIDLNYKNLYYSVLFKLGEYVDIIREKKRLISLKEQMILSLKKRKPRVCYGNFSAKTEELIFDELPPFPKDNKKMDELTREMKIAYAGGMEKIEKSLTDDLLTAHRALALANDYDPFDFVMDDEDGKQFNIVEKTEEFQDYMQIEKAKDNEVIVPEDLLSRPDEKTLFDAVKIRAALPLAKEFSKTDRPGIGKLGITSVCCALFFLILVCSVYATRFFKSGLADVSVKNVLLMAGIPLLLILLTCLIGLVVHGIHHIKYRNIFKSLYESLLGFFESAKLMGQKTRVYINKYLTVYYNYHTRFARIDTLNDEILILNNEIEKLEQSAMPINDIAEEISALSDEPLTIPEVQEDDQGEIENLVTEAIIKEIKNNTKTDCTSSDTVSMNIQSPWMKKLSLCYVNKGYIDNKGDMQ